MWRRARTGHFSISERPAAVSAGAVEREELAVDVEQGNLLALHLDQTRLTRPDLSCPRWPGDQHCEITFVPIIPVSFGENERAAIARANSGGVIRSGPTLHRRSPSDDNGFALAVFRNQPAYPTNRA
jgi:hypothetical protein